MMKLGKKKSIEEQNLKQQASVLDYVIIVIIGIILLYPLVWMFFATFKDNSEIFGSVSLLPKVWHFENYTNGWKGSAGFTYTKFFINTFVLVIPTTLLTLFSSTLVAYGFARFNLPHKKLLFTLLLAMMMLPNTVVIIPRYLLYNKFGWVDSYMPF